MKEFVKKLIAMDACEEAIEFAKDFDSLEEAWNACPRGDWMLWISAKTGCDLRTLTRAKAHCAATVKHLMKDKRSLDALQAAFDFADGNINENQLRNFANSAYAAAAVAVYADRAVDQNRKKTAEICRKYLPIPKL